MHDGAVAAEYGAAGGFVDTVAMPEGDGGYVRSGWYAVGAVPE